MSFAYVSILRLHSVVLKLSVFVIAFFALLPLAIQAQTTYTGGGAISNPANSFSTVSSTLSVSGATGPVATVSIELLGVTSNGIVDFSVQGTQWMLKSPDGREFAFLGYTGDGTDGDDQGDSGSGLDGVNITVADNGTSDAPWGAPPNQVWPHTGSLSVKPSSYAGFPAAIPFLPGSVDPAAWPQFDGCSPDPGTYDSGCSAATFSSTMTGATGDGTWTLYMNDDDGDPVSITGWSLTLTYSTATPTTTTVSSTSSNPSFNPAPTSPGGTASENSITLKATISPDTATGAVTFTSNGTTISGCSNLTVTGGTASCATSLATGYNRIDAVYTATGSYAGSSGSMTQLVEVAGYSPSSDTWCNYSPLSITGASVPLAYPSIVNVSDSSYDGKTAGTVSIEMFGMTGLSLNGQYLLVAPGGGTYNLDFLDDAFNGDSSSNADLVVSDGGVSPNNTNPTSGTYLPWDDNSVKESTFPALQSPQVDANIPGVPGTINRPQPDGGTNAFTLEEAFNGAPANGEWSLYLYGETLTVSGGYCLTFTINPGTGTTTTVSSSQQKATTGQSVTISATVASGGSPVTSGTVTFVDTTLDSTLASNVSLNSSGVAVYTSSAFAEGDHKITATYSGTTTYNSSFGTMYQREDDATSVTSPSSNAWQFCNVGQVMLPAGTTGPFTPNPSNIFVTNLPGKLENMSLTLSQFSVPDGGQINQIESLIEGPTGAALDFFSNTGSDSAGTQIASEGNYVFADGADAVSNGSGNLAPGTYEPTAYEFFSGGPDVFTSSASGFYNAPGSICYAQPYGFAGCGSSADFDFIAGDDNVFGGKSADGTWSLFLNKHEPGEGASNEGATGGWCLNLTVTPPVIAQPSLVHVGNFAQGESNAQYTVNLTNNGPGATGDPTGGSHPLTVTDVLPTGLTYSTFSGTDWACSASGQTVTCANDSGIAADSSYPELTIDVNISGSATGSVTNTITAGGAGAANQTSNTDTATIEVPPAFTSAASTTFAAGSAGTFTVTATGSPAPTFTESGPLPSGVTLSSGGVLSGTPAAGTGGTYPITITAANGTTNATLSFALTVDQAPAITSAAATTETVGLAASFTATASGFPTPTFSETGVLPSGVTFASTGVLSGTPAASAGGSYPITITASNGVGSNATQNFTLTVDQAPAITSAAATTFTAGLASSFAVTATGNPVPTFTETGALPSGVTFSSAGVLSGTPAGGTGGSYPITITAANGTANATQNFTLTVDQAAAIVSAGNTTLTVGTSGLFTVVTAAGTYPTATFSETGALPSGVTLSSAGVLSGTPAAGMGGSYSITINASNGVGSIATQNFTLTIDQAPAIVSTNSTTFTAGQSGSFTVTAPSYPPAAFSETGVLPGGVTLSSSGVLSGAPAAGAGGSYPIIITASNGVGSNATQNFTLTVGQSPAITSTASTTFTVGVSGSFIANAIGYPSPTFSETGVLPTGVTFTTAGLLSGSPAAGTAGSYPITITASNGVSPNASQNFTLSVNPAQFVLITAANPASAGSVSPASGNSFIQGTAVPITATPNPGYTFLNWTSSPDSVANVTSASTSILMNAPETATANFVANLVVTTNQDDAGTASNCTAQGTPGTGTDSACSLRDALLFAAGAGSGSITFNSATFPSSGTAAANTINLSNGTLSIPADTTIIGPTTGSGATLTNLVTISGGGALSNFAIFTVGSGVTGAAIANLIITGGHTASNGGGILNFGGLTVMNSTISGNSANNGGAIASLGGAIKVNKTTLSGNTANTGRGGGIYIDSSIFTVTSSTISGSGATTGGGIYVNSGTLTVTGSTISGNSASTGGGIANQTATITIGNSIVSGNSESSGTDVNGSYSDSGGNLIGLSPITLAPLGNYGGPTQTMIPLPGSPAICGGTPANAGGLTVDQRGYPNTNATYPGYSNSAPCLDSGAVQTNYSMQFTTQPSNGPINTAMSPAPAVTLEESGTSFIVTATSLPTVTIPLTLTGNGILANGSAAISDATGIAAYSGLSISAAGTGDTLTADLILNSASSPATELSVTSNNFNVIGILLSPATLPGATVGAAYSQLLTATGGTPSYTYTVSTGSLPPGLTLISNSGLLSGTPTGGGLFNFTVQAEDSNSDIGSEAYSLSVAATTITLAPTTLPNGTYGASYNEAISASGGTSPYTYQVVPGSGSLPGGLSLSTGGTLIGTPTAAGPFSFTVQATDHSTGTGPYTATQAYSVNINKGTATVVLGSLTQTYSGSPEAATATTTPAALSVTYTYTGTGGTIYATSSTAPTAAGDYTVVATINDPNYTGTATGTLVINKGTATVVLGSLAQTYSGAPEAATATTTPAVLTVTFMYTGTGGTIYATSSSAPTAAGNYTVVATINDPNYTGTATGMLVIARVTPTLAWTTPAAITYGTSLSATQLDASSTVAGSFTYNPAAGAILAAGSNTLSVTFTPTNTTDYSAATASVQLMVNQASQMISFMPSASVTYGAAPITLVATGGASGNPVVFNVISGPAKLSGSTLTITGTGTVEVAANQAGNSSYTAAPQVTESIVVNPGSQTISLSSGTLAYASGVSFGTAPLTLNATSTSGLSVTFSFVSGPATLNGNLLTITGAGAVVISASQAGNSDYSAAPQVTESIPVSHALPIVSLAISANPVFVQNTITFSANLTSGTGTPTGTVTFFDGTTPLGTGTLNGGVATLATSSLAAGEHSITAAYGGDLNFLAATSSPLTELVEDLSFSFSAPAVTAQPGGSAVFTFTLTPVGAAVFPANVTLSLSGLPEGATYTCSPATLTAGGGATQVTVTIALPQTQAGAAATHPGVRLATRTPTAPRSTLARSLAPFSLALILLPFAGRLRGAGRRMGSMLSVLLLLAAGMAAVAGISGCGSNDGFFGQQQQTYTITVTATAGNLSRSATLTLTVE